jgi:hypothetical protein
MFTRHKSLVSVVLAVTIVIVELEHVVDFFWEKSPIWAHTLIVNGYPMLLHALFGFLLGLLYCLIFPRTLETLRRTLRRRLTQIGTGGDSE